jgi:FdhD protein
LDKIIGAALQENSLPLAEHILLLSGRASFELIQKAMMAGIKIVAAIGAPSTLAVQAAEEAGITLVGFLRAGNFNIYTHKKRIVV